MNFVNHLIIAVFFQTGFGAKEATLSPSSPPTHYVSILDNVDNWNDCEKACQQLYETDRSCTDWDFDEDAQSEKCKLYSFYRHIKHPQGTISGSLLKGDIVSMDLSKETLDSCNGKSLYHVYVKLENMELYKKSNSIPKNLAELKNLHPFVSLDYGTASSKSFESTISIDRNTLKEEDTYILSSTFDEVIDLGEHCDFSKQLEVIISMRDNEKIYGDIEQLYFDVFQSNTSLKEAYKYKDRWHALTLFSKEENARSNLKVKISIWKPCPLLCGLGAYITIQANHFITNRPWSKLQFEITYNSKRYLGGYHTNGDTWNETFLFDHICIREGIPLTPKILINEIYDPIGKEVFGIVDKVNLKNYMEVSGRTSEIFYVKYPKYINNGKLIINNNIPNKYNYYYVRIDINTPKLFSTCVHSQHVPLHGVSTDIPLTDYGESILLSFIFILLINCIGLICFDNLRDDYYQELQPKLQLKSKSRYEDFSEGDEQDLDMNDNEASPKETDKGDDNEEDENEEDENEDDENEEDDGEDGDDGDDSEEEYEESEEEEEDED